MHKVTFKYQLLLQFRMYRRQSTQKYILLLNEVFFQHMIIKFINEQQEISMDIIREIVGGPKNRFIGDGFNLDLTYITDRIIAMAFPASGVQKLYRNSIDQVARFLTKYHNDQYITINLSGRQIDEKKLMNVKSYSWEDHRSPTFDLLFDICNEVAQFLKENPQRISVFHCNHGKGRTGTIICCFFLYTGIFKDPADALRYYAQKRFETAEGFGVTQPAQIKYIQYFYETLNQMKHPKVLAIKTISFKGQNLTPPPYFKVKYVQDKSIIINSKSKGLHTFQLLKEDQTLIRINESKYFAGDVVLDLKKQNLLSKNSLLGSIMFNTAFINKQNQLSINVKNITPLSAQKAGNLPSDFEMVIHFKQICQCDSQTLYQNRCSKCKPRLTKQSLRWKIIQTAVQNRSQIVKMGTTIVFGKKHRTQTV